MLQKWPKNLHKNCRNTFWTLTNCPWVLSHSIIREKGQNLFFTGNFAFFFKNLFSTTFRVFKIWSYYFRSETQITSWTLTKCSLRLVILDNSIIWEKNAKIFFFTRKVAFFSKLCVFKQPLRCYRIDLTSSTIIVGLPFGALQTVPWVLSPSIIREKRPKLFFHWKDSLFIQNLVFSNSFLGVTEVM